VCDPVALLLADEDVPGQLAALGERGRHLVEQVRGADDVARGLLEQVEELAVLGYEYLGESRHGGAECIRTLR
jgi:hypothetical protein